MGRSILGKDLRPMQAHWEAPKTEKPQAKRLHLGEGPHEACGRSVSWQHCDCVFKVRMKHDPLTFAM